MTTSGWRTWYSSSVPRPWMFVVNERGGACRRRAAVLSILVFSLVGFLLFTSSSFYSYFAGPLYAGTCRTASASRGTYSVCCALAAKNDRSRARPGPAPRLPLTPISY